VPAGGGGTRSATAASSLRVAGIEGPFALATGLKPRALNFDNQPPEREGLADRGASLLERGHVNEARAAVRVFRALR
jgi:Flp pilus assembly protein TadD